ncbi:MAG: hypothetical protein R2939_19240 [Kofleriaceae bacterium]
MPQTATVRVLSFTEPAAVAHVARVGGHVFVAGARGLQQWELATGTLLPLSADHGLPGEVVRGLAAAGDVLWIATDLGVVAYDVAGGVMSTMPPAPPAVALAQASTVALAPAGVGEVWIGHAGGLHRVSASGWVSAELSAPVAAVIASPDEAGAAWAGTDAGLWKIDPSGRATAIGADGGSALARVRMLLPLTVGDVQAVLAVGDDDFGRQRFAIGVGGRWTSYRLLPDARWDAATASGGSVVARVGRELVRMTHGGGMARALARVGARLVSLASGDASDIVVEPIAATLPVDPTVVVGDGDDLWIGTRTLGVARMARGGGGPRAWLRTGEMLTDAHGLSVACLARDDCWIATGARSAWHWDGAAFARGGPDVVALAAVRRADGDVYMLHRSGDQPTMSLARLRPGDLTWDDVPGIAIAPPGGGLPSVSFARFARDGRLWIGLLARERSDAAGDLDSDGVALVDLGRGQVTYHAASGAPAPGVMPIPRAALDVDFADDGAVWFATLAGAVRLRRDRLQIWDETSGLESELVRAVAAAPDGGVYIATGVGVGRWTGTAWQFPRTLGYPAWDVATGPDGALWLATARGVAVYDGDRLRRIDMRRGLIDNQVLDVAVDHVGRVWARTEQSLVLVTP